MTIKNLPQHFPGLIVLICLITLTTTVSACFDDDMIDTINEENNYVDYNGLEQIHKIYFPITDTGQVDSNTNHFGEDSDYLNLPAMSYTSQTLGGDDVVVDNITSLMWTKCSMDSGGVIDSSADCSGIDHSGTPPNEGAYTWTNAKSSCENLIFAGYDDWRLPTSHELFSITYFGNTESNEAAINETFFPNTIYKDIGGFANSLTELFVLAFSTDIKKYWTSSLIFSSDYARTINFYNGVANSNTFDYEYGFVRCVRNQ
ncbi:MAG: hypothetical protein CVV44_04240 [Spirochaetae bacterium HGW-Spirochaetae-1]|jgi:hypothetical protein|nr:MAG: hypothetical protein CVV44_04240 [Spirochaetae bacterium HGW-Spirochaetae-1]